MKRVLTFIMALMLLAVSCVPVFAAPNGQNATTTNDGKITINNAAEGETYKVYQMAVLESFSGTSYSYWLAPDKDEEGIVKKGWRDFFTTEAAKTFFSVSNDGYLTTTNNTMQESNIKTMVSDAFDYISTHNIEPNDEIVATSSTVVFDNLNLGYYLVETSLGTICSLNTTAKEAVVSDKNSEPTIVKEVQEDSGTAYSHTNDADLFQEIQFRVIVDCKKGASKYVIHDTMENMMFNAESLKIYDGSPESDESNLVGSENYTLTENVACGDGTCSFHIAFDQDFCNTMTDATDLYVFYTTSLTENAVVGGAGNKNATYLTYGNAQKTTMDETITHTYRFQMVKTDASGIYLDGATFTLWDAAEDGNRIKLVKDTSGIYRIAKDGESETVIEVIAGKPVTISGLDGRITYYLQEEAAPQGYNKLTSRQAVAISNANLDITADENPDIYSGSEGGIRVINKTGAVLPETGGMGTTMFILIGSLLVLISGVLLATKLRMARMRG